MCGYNVDHLKFLGSYIIQRRDASHYLDSRDKAASLEYSCCNPLHPAPTIAPPVETRTEAAFFCSPECAKETKPISGRCQHSTTLTSSSADVGLPYPFLESPEGVRSHCSWINSLRSVFEDGRWNLICSNKPAVWISASTENWHQETGFGSVRSIWCWTERWSHGNPLLLRGNSRFHLAPDGTRWNARFLGLSALFLLPSGDGYSGLLASLAYAC